VQGFAEFLNRADDQISSEQRAELTRIIEQQSRHLGSIVTDLIDVARDQLATADLTLDTHDLAEILSDATAMLPKAAINNVDLVTNAQPNIEVHADRRRLTQVIVNLLTNACRYGEGRVEIESFAQNGSVTIAVHDNGPGVGKRYEEAIWERFERGAHRFDSHVPGSGIGLPIARSLAQAHGGSLRHDVSGRLGGACFTMTMPRVVTPEKSTKQTEPAPA
jgi:signal transduction histidine kinase